MTTTTTSASPTKLRSGAWGARVDGSVRKGQAITITTRSGKSWQALVERVVWTDGEVSIVATSSLDRAPRSSAPRAGSRRGRRTGCQCGSREDSFGDLIQSPSNCWTCVHDAT